MARALKTYITAAGFYDLAIAAPSRTAALKAWGSRSNLFQQGLANSTDDPGIVAATRANPGVVLRRAVGSTGRFSEDAPPPKDLPVPKKLWKQAASRTKEPPPRKTAEIVEPPRVTPRQAKAKSDQQPARRDSDARKQDAARRKDDERRRQAVARAQDSLEKARRDHDARLAEIDSARAALDRRRAVEESQWRRKAGQLEKALRDARSDGS